MIDEATAQKVVAKRFTQGELSQILSDGSILVRVGKSYTKIRSVEVQNTLIQLNNHKPTEDLTQVAKDIVQAERNAVGSLPIEQVQPSTQTPDANAVHREQVAKKYGIA